MLFFFPFPATTHLDTLKAVIEIAKAFSPESITILERSGMGVAVLQMFGATPKVAQGKIFELEQIKRAVECGWG